MTLSNENTALSPELADIEELKLACVRQFRTSFDIPTTPEFANKLILEELAECEEAAEHLLKEFADLAYVSYARLANIQDGFGEQTFSMQVLKRLKTIFMLMNGMETALSRPVVNEAFLQVHLSNMSKLNPDGTVLRREDGKALKGPNYKEPDLKPLLWN